MLSNVNPFIRPKLSVLLTDLFDSASRLANFGVIISGIRNDHVKSRCHHSCECSSKSRSKTTLLLSLATTVTTHKNFFVNPGKTVSHGAISFHFNHLVNIRVSPLSDTTRVTPGRTINTLKTSSPLLLGLGGSVSLSILSDTKWVVWFLSSKAWTCY